MNRFADVFLRPQTDLRPENVDRIRLHARHVHAGINRKRVGPDPHLGLFRAIRAHLVADGFHPGLDRGEHFILIGDLAGRGVARDILLYLVLLLTSGEGQLHIGRGNTGAEDIHQRWRRARRTCDRRRRSHRDRPGWRWRREHQHVCPGEPARRKAVTRLARQRTIHQRNVNVQFAGSLLHQVFGSGVHTIGRLMGHFQRLVCGESRQVSRLSAARLHDRQLARFGHQVLQFLGLLGVLGGFGLEVLAFAGHGIKIGDDGENRDHCEDDADQVFLDDVHKTLVANRVLCESGRRGSLLRRCSRRRRGRRWVDLHQRHHRHFPIVEH